jgi:hypothetical protein
VVLAQIYLVVLDGLPEVVSLGLTFLKIVQVLQTVDCNCENGSCGGKCSIVLMSQRVHLSFQTHLSSLSDSLRLKK